PEPPKSLKDAWQYTRPVFMKVMDMAPKVRSGAPCQEVVWEGSDVDLARLPIQTCWPGDVAPLITWGLTVTRGPHKKRQNLGIYRQQVIARNKVIMRWLSMRGGALDFRDHAAANPGAPFPVFTIGRMTLRPDPIYHSTYTGKPPDEPAILGMALNEVFVPLLQKQYPEIVDFYLPPEGCSYRIAVVALKKQYAGHAKRVM